jgi:hypothetical protein
MCSPRLHEDSPGSHEQTIKIIAGLFAVVLFAGNADPGRGVRNGISIVAAKIPFG